MNRTEIREKQEPKHYLAEHERSDCVGVEVFHELLHRDGVQVSWYVDPSVTDQAVQALCLHQFSNLIYSLLYAPLVQHI